MILTKKQGEFLDALAKGKNIFLSGMAGTGKSTVTKTAFDVVRDMGKKFIAVAPTGIAASNIDGVTIHSQFGVSPYGVATFETANFLKQMKRDVLAKTDVIFIDEVSMVRADLLDAMHWTCRKNHIPGLDSKQIIFIGDMGQLKPVVDDGTRAVMLQTYKGVEFFHAQIYKKLNPITIELDEVVRQNDREFIDALNIIRGGGKSPYFRRFVHTEPHGVILAPHNATVSEYNVKGLIAQEGQEFTFKADLQGEMKYSDTTLEPEITVKHGCKIMYLVNSRDAPLRNGTLGSFVVKQPEFNPEHDEGGIWDPEDKYFIRVGSIEYELRKYLAVKKQYVYNKAIDELELIEIGSIEQYPFKLAYAISIHKSQGLTLEELTVDLRRPCFESGQMYVALSRVKTPEGLRIITN